MAEQPVDYSRWSNENLIERVSQLERQLKEQTAKYNIPASPASPVLSSPQLNAKSARVNRDFDPSKYSTRLIALKFAYLGQRYNGFEHHSNNTTPLPTIEEELWKALNKARLVFPTDTSSTKEGEVNWSGCEYSKCGRTDKGVSAFGQVIGIRVRSNRPLSHPPADKSANERDLDGNVQHDEDNHRIAKSYDGLHNSPPPSTSLSAPFSDDSNPFHPVDDEIPYMQVLNRLLPPDIRVLAWCPSPPPDFSARFSCKERRYRYVFTQPAFTPTAGAAGLTAGVTHAVGGSRPRREGWLDIDAMKESARKFVGVHDFRNFCKVDASKQIENFERRIYHSDIEEVDPSTGPAGYVGSPGFQEFAPLAAANGHASSAPNDGLTETPRVFHFALHGSAFLWHQVRHMVAILFLIGQGLEPPILVDELLNVKNTPRKPMYEMADDAPLVLWDCIFPDPTSNNKEDALDWVYVGDTSGKGNGVIAKGNGKYGMGGVVADLWKIWRQRKIDEVLAGTLLDVVVAQGSGSRAGREEDGEPRRSGKPPRTSQKVFDGGNAVRLVGKYTPVLQKPRMESVEIINARYAARKGLDEKEGPRDQ
ncbi:MAG: pseudouridylate synthase 3 [Lasallia pustulata]|uniref:Pseudouridylate synthase 3 n=1 Tax=Lasallia pustulata TaxID=136370 RepID=A0A5M8Q027_9LECA|nr:MAG: pseudouridylate synthase 3 [Lasallia pustulata]